MRANIPEITDFSHLRILFLAFEFVSLYHLASTILFAASGGAPKYSLNYDEHC